MGAKIQLLISAKDYIREDATRSHGPQYTMQDENGQTHILQETTEEKDIGIWMDNSLKFSVHELHAAQAASKANQTRGVTHKRMCQTSLRANVLGFRIANFWNSVPEDIVSSPLLY